MKLDRLGRCKRCKKIPRGKRQREVFKRCLPFCSFHCQERYRQEEVMERNRRAYGTVHFEDND